MKMTEGGKICIKFKKIFAAVLVLVMMFSFFPSGFASADESEGLPAENAVDNTGSDSLILGEENNSQEKEPVLDEQTGDPSVPENDTDVNVPQEENKPAEEKSETIPTETSEKVYHIVTFYGFDDEVLGSYVIEDGCAAITPEAPEVSGYRFIEWDTDFSNIHEDTDVYAIYEESEETPAVVETFVSFNPLYPHSTDEIAEANEEAAEMAEEMQEENELLSAPVLFSFFGAENESEEGGYSLGAAPEGESTAVSFYESTVNIRNAFKSNADTYTECVLLEGEYDSIPNGIGNATVNNLISEAMKHTGIPDEGDYILYRYNGVSGSTSTKLENRQLYVSIDLNLKYYTTAQQEQQVSAKFSELTSQLHLKDAYLTGYEKFQNIYEYICQNVSYDYAHSNMGAEYPVMFTAYGALCDGTCVCQGYSGALYRLCLLAGIDCRIDSNSTHAWNIIKKGNNYYRIDATQDTSVIANGKAANLLLGGGAPSRTALSGYTLCSTDYPCVARETNSNAQFPQTQTCEFTVDNGREICPVCGDSRLFEIKVKLSNPGPSVYVDGKEVAIDGEGYVTLPGRDSRVITTMSYLQNSQGYAYPDPSALKVYFIEKNEETGAFTAEEKTELSGLLQYAGSSIKIKGEQGIRTITEIPSAAKSMLKSGFEGWTLQSYGTAVAWDNDIDGGDPTLDMAVTKSATAYVKGSQDAVFATNGSNIQYTNVLTFDTYEKCKPVLAMRPFLTLSNGTDTMTIYGGTVHRSIVFIAYQNKDAYRRGTAEFKFIHAIIDACGVPDGLDPVEPDVCNYLCIGNSMTYLYPDNVYWWGSWGSSASTAANDYYHQTVAGLSNLYGTVNSQVYYYGYYTEADGSEAVWEHSANRSSCLYMLDGYLNEDLTLVSIQLGENCTDKSTFQTDMIELVQYIQAKCPKAQVMIIGDCWGFAECDAMKITAANATGATFVDLSAIKNNTNYRAGMATVYGDDGKPHAITNMGMATHLGDRGHAYMASAILSLVK